MTLRQFIAIVACAVSIPLVGECCYRIGGLL